MSAQTIVPIGAASANKTIQTAYDAIKAAAVTTPISGAYVLELQSDYDPTAGTTLETFPITLNAINGASATNSITIRPASGVSKTLVNNAGAGTVYNYTTSAVSNISKITVANTVGMNVNDKVAGNGITDQTTVTAIDGNTITLSTPAANSHAVTNPVFVGVRASAAFANANVAIGQTVIKLNGPVTIQNGDYVTGTSSIPAGTTVTYDVATTTITLSAATTAGWTASNVRLYFGPNTAVSTTSTAVSNTLTFSSVANLAAGMTVSGSGFNRVIESVDGTNKKVTLVPGTTQAVANNTSLVFAASQTKTIVFDGAKYVTIDGQSGGTGGAKNLTISATTTDANAATIAFVNDSYKNTVKYCTVLGASASITNNPVSGTVFIGTTTGTTARAGSYPNFTGSGNLYNTIDNCDIAEAASGTLPTAGVYMVGTSTFTNEGNAITNCNIYNFFNPGAFISSGVYNDANSLTTTISGNKLYQTATRTYTGNGLLYPIYVNAPASTGTTTVTVADNVIGYSSNSGTGRMTITNGNPVSLTVASKFAGIFINAHYNQPNVWGNTITAIDFTSASAGAAGQGVCVGIYQQGGNLAAATVAKPNIISDINLYFTVSTTSTFGLAGCSYNYGSGSANFVYTNVFGLSAIPVGTNANTIIGKVIGIYSTGPYNGSGKLNKVYNLSCGAAGSSVAHIVQGINLNNGSNTTLTLERNLIYNLNAISTGVSVITGLTATAGTAEIRFYNNIISLGTDVTSDAVIHGIYVNMNVARNNYYLHNTVYIGGEAIGSANNTHSFTSEGTTTSTCVLQNNIFVNKRTNKTGIISKHYALRVVTSKAVSACDYNLYWSANSATLASIVGTDYSNPSSAPAWVGATPSTSDANSNIGNPNFLNTSALDFHLTSSSALAIAEGMDRTARVADDFDGDKRTGGATKQDIGADDISALNTWTGTTSSDWDVTTNWSNAAKPTATNGSVVIPAGVTNIPVISATNATCNNIILQPGAQLSLNSGKTLTISGNVSLQSDATNGTATIKDMNAAGGITVSGATTAQQYLTTGRNWYVASPVASATSAVFGAASSATNKLWYYSETTGTSAPWAQITNNTTSLTPGKGYVANMPSNGVVTFSGALNTGALTTTTLTRTTGQTGEGFNLVGNPYASYLDWNAVTKTNVMPTMWYRTKVGGTYKFYTYLNGTGALEEDGITVPAGVSNLIPPMQGFWVQVASGQTTGSLSVTNAMRAHKDASGNMMKAPAAKKSALPLLRLQLSDGVNDDETVIYLSQNVSNGLDNFDAAKMLNTGNTVPEIYSEVAGEKLAINGLNSDNSSKAVALGLKTGTASSFSIRATEVKNMDANTRIVLINNKNNVETDMTDGGVYSFDLDAVNASNPFTVVFRTAGSTTGIDTAKGNDISVLVNAANQIELIAPANIKYGVYNLAGQCMVNGVTTSNRSIVNSKLAAGVYMVKVAGEQTKRVSIK